MTEPITILHDRMSKIGIELTFVSNVPWIYLDTINGKKVTEKTPDANHGFNIAWYSVRKDGPPLRFTNTKEMFQLIENTYEKTII